MSVNYPQPLGLSSTTTHPHNNHSPPNLEKQSPSRHTSVFLRFEAGPSAPSSACGDPALVAALRFEVMSWERGGRKGVRDVAGNQYSGGVNVAAFYSVLLELNDPPIYGGSLDARKNWCSFWDGPFWKTVGGGTEMSVRATLCLSIQG